MDGYKGTKGAGEYSNLDTAEKSVEYREEKEQPAGHGPIRDTVMKLFADDVRKEGGNIATSPAVNNGVLFFGASDTFLYALDAATGELLWKFKTNGPILSYPLVYDNNVYVRCSVNSYLYSISADGDLVWKLKLNSEIASSPVIVDDILYIGTGEGDQHMYAISTKDGRLVWKYRTGGGGGMPSVVNDTIFFGSGDGYVYALSKDGELKWKFRTSDGVDTMASIVDEEGREIWSMKNMNDRMVHISGGTLYIGSWDNNVYALTLDGKELWRFRTGGPIVFSSPAVHKGVVYIGSFDGHLYALDAATGLLKWKFRTNMPITADPLIHNDIIYIGSLDNCLYAVSPDGKELWKFWTGGYVAAAATVYNDRIYFGSWDSYLYALSLDGKLVWKFKTGKLESVKIDIKSIIYQTNEMNKRVFRVWKPETVAGNGLVFSDFVSVSPLYRSALAYSTEIPYKGETPYAAAKKKSKWLF